MLRALLCVLLVTGLSLAIIGCKEAPKDGQATKPAATAPAKPMASPAATPAAEKPAAAASTPASVPASGMAK